MQESVRSRCTTLLNRSPPKLKPSGGSLVQHAMVNEHLDRRPVGLA
jgi:hypothetical protein